MTNRFLVVRRVAMLVVYLSLLAPGLAAAQELPDGTFASDIESCSVLETKTPTELGDELNFQVLSKKGLIAYQQTCDFVTVVPHKPGLWVATAICDELGYTYPDLFSIKQKDEGRLNVTRLTDLNQEGGEAPAQGSDGAKAPDENAETPNANDPDLPPDERAEKQPPESYSTFVKCPNVKP